MVLRAAFQWQLVFLIFEVSGLAVSLYHQEARIDVDINLRKLTQGIRLSEIPYQMWMPPK